MAEAAVDNPVIVNMSGSAQYYLKYLPFLYLVRPDVYVMFDHVHNIVNRRFCDKQAGLVDKSWYHGWYHTVGFNSKKALKWSC